MEIKTEAVVLQAIDYKDNDKLLTLFSPSLGKITAGIRGVKKSTAKLAFAAQPFCFAEYVLAVKGDRYTVTSAYLHESFFDLRTDFDAFYAACAAAEACRLLTVENERYEGLFIGFVQCLQALCQREESVAEGLITFLLIALRESGYPLDLEYDREVRDGDTLWFDFAFGRFAPFEECASGVRASLSTYHTLRKCEGLDFDERLIKGGEKRALRLLRAYLCDKTELNFDGIGEVIRALND